MLYELKTRYIIVYEYIFFVGEYVNVHANLNSVANIPMFGYWDINIAFTYS
jgi:hypothetical protein